MADPIKDKVVNAGQAAADATKDPGSKVASGSTQAKDCGAANVGAAGIQERMDVIASCGKKVGVVDHVEGVTIKMTKNDSPDGQHHFIPTGWVDHVDSRVHLKKNSMETEQGWKSDAASCIACGA